PVPGPRARGRTPTPTTGPPSSSSATRTDLGFPTKETRELVRPSPHHRTSVAGAITGRCFFSPRGRGLWGFSYNGGDATAHHSARIQHVASTPFHEHAARTRATPRSDRGLAL